MIGRLYGIGTGPGDPELLTLKAINTIQSCEVVAVPTTGEAERVAYNIVEKYLAGKELLECRFSMDRELAKREEARQVAAAGIIEQLDKGKDVAFITLGDPTTYSTYMYVHKIIVEKGYQAEIIPGISSYSAAAAALGIALCEGNESLMIIPARHEKNFEEILEYSGNKVIMKSGANLAQVLGSLKERGYNKKTKIACGVTMAGQQLFTSIEDYENAPEGGYFTIAIVKENE